MAGGSSAVAADIFLDSGGETAASLQAIRWHACDAAAVGWPQVEQWPEVLPEDRSCWGSLDSSQRNGRKSTCPVVGGRDKAAPCD